MGMSSYLSGVVSFNSTTHDKKTDSRIIAPEHQQLRDLCKITHPYPEGGGPLIFFPIMNWYKDWIIHSAFINLNEGIEPDDGDKAHIPFNRLEDLSTHLQIVFSGECDDKEEEIELLNDVFLTDAYSFTDQEYKEAWDRLKQFSNFLSELVAQENDPKTFSFGIFYYEAHY